MRIEPPLGPRELGSLLPLLVAALVVLPALALAGPLADDEQVATPAKPFDPLTTSEETRALEVGLANETVEGLLSGHHEPIGAALYTDKARVQADQMPRMAEVWAYDYASDTTVVAFVNLDRDTVDRVDVRDLQPPMTAREKHRVGQIALDSDPVLENLTADNVDADVDVDDLDWIARLWTGPNGTACPEHRCALVAFTTGEAYLPAPQVVVDLSAGEVRQVLASGLVDASGGSS